MKLLLLLPVIATVGLVATFLALDHTAAYRSPLSGAEPPAPRADAIVALDTWYREKAEEEARIAELLANLDTPTMVELGKDIVHGRGLCFNCHRVGAAGTGTQGPDLEDVGSRAGDRVDGMSDVEYFTESLFEPNAYVVEGFQGVMTPADEAPIGLSELDALMVIAYLQSLGGTPSVGPDTELAH